jgi:hypothetical protein
MTGPSIRDLILVSMLLSPLGGWAAPGAGGVEPSSRPAEAAADPAPRGTPEDQALWTALVTTQNAVTISRAQALQLMRQLDEARYDLRLTDVAGKATGEAATKAEGLRRRLLEAWNATFQALTRQWPVDPRLGCRTERLNLEGAMEAADAGDLQVTRSAARPCLEKMAGAVSRMEQANRDLAAVIGEVQAVVPAVPPSKAPGGGAPSPPPVPPAGPPADRATP